MLITCISGGLLPDFNKCVPFGEHDLAMYIGENLYFVFYDIYDCKASSRFSLSTFLDIDKECKMTKEEMEYKSKYFKKHTRALVESALFNPEVSLFFNTVQVDVLSKFFFESKFSCKVDIVLDERRVEIDDLKDNKEIYNRVMSFMEEFKMCEMISSSELAKVRAGIYKRKPSMGSIIATGVVTGVLGAVAGVAFGRKFSSKKQNDIELPIADDNVQQEEE